MMTERSLSNERFGFTIFLSACIHIMLIVGIGFSYLEKHSSAAAIEVTLAQYRSDTVPDRADFIAQDNQVGSGALDQAAAPSTPFVAIYHDEVIEEVTPLLQAPAPGESSSTAELTVLSSRAGEEAIQRPDDGAPTNESDSIPDTPEDISLAIASLQAQLDLQQQAYARRPRRHTISSASTQQRHDALYLDAWRRRIEMVGNQHYPEQARQQGIFGSLRMMVALRANGTVEEIRILQSSGERILDEAAVEIVRLSSPFDPFPEEIRADVDILEIIRTWRFHQGNSFTSD